MRRGHRWGRGRLGRPADHVLRMTLFHRNCMPEDMATGSTQIGKREGACASGPRWRRTHQAPTHTPFQKSAPASGPPLCCCSRTQSKTNCARKESAGVCHSRLGRGRGESSTHRAMACLHSLMEGAATSSWILAPPATLLCPEQGMGAWQPTAPACLTLNSTFWSSGVAFLGAGGLGGEATAEWPMVERRHTRWPESLQHDRSRRSRRRLLRRRRRIRRGCHSASGPPGSPSRRSTRLLGDSPPRAAKLLQNEGLAQHRGAKLDVHVHVDPEPARHGG